MVDIFYQLSLWGVWNLHYIFEMKRLYFENLFYLSHKHWQNDFSSNVTLVVYSHLLLFLRVFSYNVVIGDQIGRGIVTHVIYYIMIIDSLTSDIFELLQLIREVFSITYFKQSTHFTQYKVHFILCGTGSHDCQGTVLKLPRIYAYPTSLDKIRILT